MTATLTDPAGLTDQLIYTCPAAPDGLTLARELAHYRTEATRRAHAEVTSPSLLAEVLELIPAEVAYIHARPAGERVAETAMIDTDQTDYFDNPLPRTALTKLKREATAAAKALARELLADPLDYLDAIKFEEGMALAVANAKDDTRCAYSEVSKTVYAEVRRIMDSWAVTE